jgi:hypothetical protein
MRDLRLLYDERLQLTRNGNIRVQRVVPRDDV